MLCYHVWYHIWDVFLSLFQCNAIRTNPQRHGWVIDCKQGKPKFSESWLLNYSKFYKNKLYSCSWLLCCCSEKEFLLLCAVVAVVFFFFCDKYSRLKSNRRAWDCLKCYWCFTNMTNEKVRCIVYTSYTQLHLQKQQASCVYNSYIQLKI